MSPLHITHTVALNLPQIGGENAENMMQGACTPASQVPPPPFPPRLHVQRPLSAPEAKVVHHGQSPVCRCWEGEGV